MNIKQFGVLIDRYLTGNASLTEIEAIDRWLDQTGESTESMTHSKRMRMQEEMLQKIRQVMPNQTYPRYRPLLKIIKPYLRIAAVLVATIGLLFLYQKYQTKDAQMLENKVVYEIYRTPKGLKAILTLSDGSLIHLNSATTVRYPKKFQGSTREVMLEEGEAFFEIRPNQRKPFIVHAAHQIDTRVLGTTFNISSYRASTKFRLSVNTGRVQVSKTNGKSRKAMGIFTPGQGLSYQPGTDTFKRLDLDAGELAGWRNNVLTFKDADFNELKQQLENWYGIEIRLQAQAVPSALFTGRFNNKSLEEVLRALQRINKFSYELKGKTLNIENQTKHLKSERKPM